MCAVGEVGGEECDCVGVEVEFVFEFVEEFFMGDCVVCFGKVEENGDCGEFFLFIVDDSVDDFGECHGCVRVGAESVGVGGEYVM